MHNKYKNPVPTVDIIIEINKENTKNIVLIERKNPPFGWALPGGFVDYNESLENAAIREAKEETNLEIVLTKQFHTYSNPDRDPRQHNISTVFIATSSGTPSAADDAKNVKIFALDNLPEKMAFDHKEIIQDYIDKKY